MHVTQEQLEKSMAQIRLWIQEDTRRIVEELLLAQRDGFNMDVVRHMSVLAGEYQWRLSALGEKVDLTWEKSERKYAESDKHDMLMSEKVALLEQYLPMHPRQHKGQAQAQRARKDKTKIHKKVSHSTMSKNSQKNYSRNKTNKNKQKRINIE